MQNLYTKERISELNNIFLESFCPDECPHFSYNDRTLESPIAPYCKLGFDCLNDTCPAKLLLKHIEEEYKDMERLSCIDCEHWVVIETMEGYDRSFCKKKKEILYDDKTCRDYKVKE